jgi:hypothetical protein
MATTKAADQPDDTTAAYNAVLLAALKAALAAVENRDASDALLYAQTYRTLIGD